VDKVTQEKKTGGKDQPQRKSLKKTSHIVINDRGRAAKKGLSNAPLGLCFKKVGSRSKKNKKGGVKREILGQKSCDRMIQQDRKDTNLIKEKQTYPVTATWAGWAKNRLKGHHQGNRGEKNFIGKQKRCFPLRQKVENMINRDTYKK